MEFEHRMSDLTNLLDGRKDWTHVPITPVKISSKSWVCFGATILRGVIVGEGAVVGAKSVVTRDVEPWTVVAGNPAKFIRNLKPS
jgi:galactoside O-acetyltransferase